MWWVYALLSAFFAGVVAVLGKAALKDVHPDVATAIRTVVILLLTWGIVWAKGMGEQVRDISTRSLLLLAIGGCATGLSWLFYFRALSAGTVSKVASIDKLSLVVALLLSYLFFGERLTLPQLGGAFLIVAGTLLLLYK
jgi:bacterial/archaeal transporter family protein